MNQIEKAISAILKTSLAEKEKGNAILAILATCEESQTSSTITKKHHKNTPQETFVYLIKNAEGHIKIGFSGNPEKRLSQLKTGCPSAVLLHKFIGTMQDEKYFHSMFANKNIANEWFLLNENDIEIIINYFDIDRRIKRQLPHVLIDCVMSTNMLFKPDGIISQNKVEDFMNVGRPKAKRFIDALKEKGILNADGSRNADADA